MHVHPDGQDPAALVQAAASGDAKAWERLVDSYSGLIAAITRGFRLGHSDAGDVSQTTWLRLVENIHRLDEPERVGAWLATTARRECLRAVARRNRQVPVAEPDVLADAHESETAPVDAGLLAREQQEHVRNALDQLPPRGQQLMQLLMLDPAPSYEEISAALAMPIGSIGPTRGRCLHKLHQILDAGGHCLVHSDRSETASARPASTRLSA